MTTQQSVERGGPTRAADLQREEPLRMRGRRPSHQPNRRVEEQPQQLARGSADVNPFDLLLGDNLAHYMNTIEPLLHHNQAHMPTHHPAITDWPTLAQPLTAARSLATANRRAPAHNSLNRAQASVRNVRNNPRPRLRSPPMRARQPAQERANNNPAEAAQAQAQATAVPPPKNNNTNNASEGRQPAKEGRPPRGASKRTQDSARLHAAGKCIWCREDNPDTSRMGCPECRRRRVKLTERWRQRVLARDSGNA